MQFYRVSDLLLKHRQELRKTLSVQRRVTATYKQKDGKTLHVRKSTQPDNDLLKFYQTLKVNPLPGGTLKLIH